MHAGPGGSRPVANGEPVNGEPVGSEQVNDEPGMAGNRPAGRWHRLRAWFPFLVKPVRRVVLIFALLLIIEYLVVPELVGASKDLYLLGRVNAAWLVAGVLLEFLSLFC